MKNISNWLYRMIRFCVWLFYPEMEVEGLENLPNEPCIIASNHAQMNGPISSELYFPGAHSTWCAQEMMHLEEVPGYAFQDFWSEKPTYSKWFYKLLSYLIAPISVCVFNNARTIPVYRDNRILTTFRETLKKLKEGESIVIFPEHNQPYAPILWDFQTGFVDIARSYYKQTGKCLSFVPMYLAPALGKMYLGTPVQYEPEAPMKEERRRICDYLMKEIVHIARELPDHRVVPYPNIPKADYPYNHWQEAQCNEKTGG